LYNREIAITGKYPYIKEGYNFSQSKQQYYNILKYLSSSFITLKNVGTSVVQDENISPRER
jgi:hypothetical protein